ncbi:hypothetical protein MKX03_012540, partial [Papaver bracteatum]
MPIEMGKLISLRTLSLFLKDLHHLKGYLDIRGLENVKNETDSRNSNLILKKHLRSLNLYWSSGLPETEEEEQAQLM